jgi:hypothetical protein
MADVVVEIVDGRGVQGPPGDLGLAVDLGARSGTIDLSGYVLRSQVFRLVAGGDIGFTVAKMPQVLAGQAGSFSVRVQQGATPRTVFFETAIRESFGNSPTLTATAGAVDILTFMWTGVEWVCFLSAAAIA